MTLPWLIIVFTAAAAAAGAIGALPIATGNQRDPVDTWLFRLFIALAAVWLLTLLAYDTPPFWVTAAGTWTSVTVIAGHLIRSLRFLRRSRRELEALTAAYAAQLDERPGGPT